MTELERVIVTATRREALLGTVPEIALTVDRTDIDGIAAREVSEILDYLPGLSTEGGTGGGLPFKKTVTIDGMPVLYSVIMVDGTRLLSSHIHTGVNVNIVPIESIERIELVKGAASAQYGSDALGGVLNIITKKGSAEPSLTVTTSGGSANTLRAGLSLTGAASPSVYYSGFGGLERSDGLPIKEPASRKDAFSYTRSSLMGRIDVAASDNLSLNTSVHYFGAEAPFGGTMCASRLITPKLGFTYNHGKSFDMAASAYYTRWDNEKNDELNEDYSPEVTFGISALKHNYILIGGDYHLRNFARKRVEEHYQHAVGGFIQDELRALDWLTVLAALRIDAVDNQDADAADLGPIFSPKLSLLLKPAEPLQIRASVGRGFRAPTVQDLYETLYGHADDQHFRAGNRDLKPEYSVNVTGGVEWKPHDRVAIVVNGYYNHITDMITPVDHGLQAPGDLFDSADVAWVLEDTTYDSVYIYQRENIDEAMVAGGEIMVSWRFYKQFRLDLGFSGIHNENKRTKESLPYYPGQALFAKLGGRHAFTDAIALGGFIGLRAVMNRSIWRYKEDKEQKVALDDYQKLDVGLTLRLLDKLEFHVAARNLLAQELHMYEDKELKTVGKPLLEGGLRLDAF